MVKTTVAKNIKFIFDIEQDQLKDELLIALINKHKNIVNNRFKILQNYFVIQFLNYYHEQPYTQQHHFLEVVPY